MLGVGTQISGAGCHGLENMEKHWHTGNYFYIKSENKITWHIITFFLISLIPNCPIKSNVSLLIQDHFNDFDLSLE